MNQLISQLIIKELCGEYSYKKGESLYQRNKVIFSKYDPDSSLCEAKVKGNSDFFVTLENKNGQIAASCSCPTLASIEKRCQHVAAVLVGIRNLQNRSTEGHSLFPNPSFETPDHSSRISASDIQLTNHMLDLFVEKPVPLNSMQHHVDNRELVDVEFSCKPIRIDQKQHLLGIELSIGNKSFYPIRQLRAFLNHIKQREIYQVANEFSYNPTLHCFTKENDAVIRMLIQVYQNESIYLNTLNTQRAHLSDAPMMLLPASSLERILPLLLNAPLVKLMHADGIYHGFTFSDEKIPLMFEFGETTINGSYQLNVRNLKQITVMEAYGYVLFENKLKKVKEEDSNRLIELKQMLTASGKHQFIIPANQIEEFVEKVIPGLMKLGSVHLSKVVAKRLDKAPLKAKLYLDRLKNRLLAGLEFQYGNLVINPLEENQKQTGVSPLLRDEDKEQEILQLMEESLFSKTEEGYYLHNEDLEYTFLYHIVPKLKNFVEIYATTAVRSRLFTKKAHPKIRIKRGERTDWLVFRFDINGIPDAEIRDLLTSMEEKRKYYRLRNGSILSLETAEFKELNRFINGLGVDINELDKDIQLPMTRGMQVINELDNDEVIVLEDSLRQFLDELRNPTTLTFPIPEQLTTILRDYQKQGYQWLRTLAQYRFGGILADDMGLGKTLQSITFILSVLPEIRDKKLPVIIVAPSSLLYNWWNELKKFAPEINPVIITGPKIERQKLLKNVKDFDVVITSYPLLLKDANLYNELFFHTFFLDEAQAFKNYETKTAKVVKQIKATNRYALTGTPVENSIDELWSIFEVVFPTLLPGRKEFHNLTRKSITKRVAPFILRRLKTDVLDELPDKIESIHSSELHPEQKKLYVAYLSKLKHDALKHLNKNTLQKNKIKILAGLTRLRQLCCHPALFIDGYKGSSAKFDQLMTIVNECQSTGRRVLIFSQFTKMLDIIGRDLARKGIPYFYLDGKTPSSERVELCDRFNNGEKDLFLISLKAGGTGLNLTGADTVILYDLWWNPAVEQQAADRAHRIGQKEVVQVIKLVAEGTIEDKMNELQEKKKNLIEEIIHPTLENSGSLSEEDIKEILMI